MKIMSWRNIPAALFALYTGLPVQAAENQPSLDISPTRGIIAEWQAPEARLKLGGRLQIDAARYSGDDRGFDDDVDVRRARIYASGRLENWRAKVDYDVGGVVDGWKNVWVRYQGIKGWRFQLGNQIAPFSPQEMSSSDNLPFMERSLASALSAGFLSGLVASTWGESWHASAAIMGDPVDADDERKADGKGLFGRFGFVPWQNDAWRVQLGTAGELRDIDDNNKFRLRTRPEAYIGAVRLVDTGRIASADKLANLAFNANLVGGPLVMEGEYIASNVDRDTGSSLSFNGYHISASYFLTGEEPRVSRRTGLIRSVLPQGRWGAVQVGLRYSSIDLSDDDIDGGDEQNWTVGLNWFVTRALRLSANYINVSTSPGQNGRDAEPDIFQIRFQYAL